MFDPTMGVKIPQKGDRYEVIGYPGYKAEQDRPFACRRRGCVCGGCNGVRTVYPGTVERIIAWADNSYDAVVACDDGETRTTQLVAPHGDVCF